MPNTFKNFEIDTETIGIIAGIILFTLALFLIALILTPVIKVIVTFLSLILKLCLLLASISPFIVFGAIGYYIRKIYDNLKEERW